MANPFDAALPSVGEKPWTLNPAILELRGRQGTVEDVINTGRLSASGLADEIAEAAASVEVNDATVANLVAEPTSETSAAILSAVSILDSTGAGDEQSGAINAALTSISGTGRTLVLRGTFLINNTITVPTTCGFDTTQAVVRSASGFANNMLRLNTGVLRTVTGSVALGSAVITAATGSFTSADIGRSLIVPEAGPDVINAELGTGTKKQNLTGIVQSVASDGSSATIDRAATQAASSKPVTVHNRVSDVTLTLGVWDRQDNAGSGTGLHSIFLRRGDRVRLRSLKYRARFQSGTLTGGKYGVSYGDMIDFEAGELGLDFISNSDGIHGIGPLVRPKIRNVSGTTHDDLVAIGISDYADYADIAGPVVDPVVENISAVAEARAVLLTANVRSDYRISGAVVRTVRGETQSPLVRVTGSNDLAGDISGHMGVQSVRFDDIQGTPRTVSPLISLNGRIGDVLVTGANLKQTSGNGGVAKVDENSEVDSLILSGLSVAPGHDGNLIEVPTSSKLHALTIEDANLIKSGTGCLFYGAGVVDRVTLRNYRQQGGRGLDIRRDVSVCEVTLSGVRTDVPIVRPSGGSTVFTVFASDTVYTGTTEGLIRLAAGTGSCTFNAGQGVSSASGKLMSRSSTQRLRANGLTARQTVADITPEPGDIMFNTDPAQSVGVGPCIYDLSTLSWKSLGTSGGAGSVVPPTNGLSGQPVNAEVLTDTYSRTASEVVGTLPDAGGLAYTGATGRWQVSSGRLVKGATLDTQACFVKAPAKGDMTATFTLRTGTTESSSITDRIFLKAIDANNGIRLQRTGQTGASMTLSVVTGGTARQLGSTVTNAIPASTAPADYSVTITVSTSGGTTTASAVVNGVSFPGGALTSTEVATLYDATNWGIGSTSPNTQVDELHVTVNGSYL